MAQKDDWPPPATILATDAAVAGGLLALGYTLKLILPAFGAAVGLAVATARTGLATGGFVVGWVVPAAGAGLGATGAVLTVRLLISIEETMRDKPYEWTLPLLGVAAGLALTLWKDLTGAPQALRLTLGGIVALWIVIAGACYKRHGWL